MKLKIIAALAAAGLGVYLIGRRQRKTPGKIITTQKNQYNHHLTDVFAKAKTHPV
jgi:hypothetical protein